MAMRHPATFAPASNGCSSYEDQRYCERYSADARGAWTGP